MSNFDKNIDKTLPQPNIYLNGNAAFIPIKGMKVPACKSKDQAWEELFIEIKRKKEEQVQVIPFYKKYITSYAVAASIIILIGFGFSVFYFSQTTITCPRGEQISVYLPDQSVVTLNSETQISYHTFYWNNHRSIKLSGEAFFKVQKGKKFTVKTPIALISVLGTKFNVYSRQEEVKVNCFTGKVAVNNRRFADKIVYLSSGMGTVLSKNKSPLAPQAFDTLKTAQWTKGEFYFNHEKISHVLDELERQYKIEIEYKGDSNRYYSGFFNNSNLNDALQMVCAPMKLNYKITNYKITINQ